MRSIVLFSFVTVCCVAINLFNCVNATNSTEPKKLQVDIYYETLCPDSKYFVRKQLYDAMKLYGLLPYTDLKFIPYGKVNAFIQSRTNSTMLFCQHGDQECELNALHACIVEHNTVDEQMKMFACLFTGCCASVDYCSDAVNIDVSAAKNCKNTRTTSDILKPYGDKTATIPLTFVPAIGLNGTFEAAKQEDLLKNFTATFCRQYNETFGVLLENCKPENLNDK